PIAIDRAVVNHLWPRFGSMRPELLHPGCIRIIVSDHGIGTIQDGLVATIILLEVYDSDGFIRTREIFFKFLNVADVRPPPRVDGLVRIPNDKHVMMGLC